MFAFLTSLIFSKTFAVIAVLATAFHFYCKRRYSYWSKRGIKGPDGRYFIGLFLDFMFYPFNELEERYSAKYGKIFGVYEGFRPILRIADAELIKNILIKDFHLFVNRRREKFGDPAFDDGLLQAQDDHWKKLRSIISPTFSSGKMKKMFSLVEDCVQSCIEVINKAAEDKSDVDLRKFFGNLTMDVIGRCAFATKLNTHENDKHPFVENAKKVFRLNPGRMLMFLLPSFIRTFFDARIIDPSAAEFFRNVVDQLKKERSKTVSKKGAVDFLQLMIESQKNNNLEDDNEDTFKETKTRSKNNEEPLTDDEVFANCFTFFFAGYETTAALLSFLTYCVTVNPECQQRLYEEVKDAVDEKGNISYEKLANLEYLDACINETLRLYNPAIAVERSPSEDYKLGDTGIVIEKNIVIQISIHAVHHSEEYFPEPYRFNPDRFLPENRDKLVPYTFLAFGAGSRNCVGMRFALMEAKLAMAKIIKDYQFVKCDKTQIPLQFNKGVFVLQAKNITVKVQKRS